MKDDSGHPPNGVSACREGAVEQLRTSLRLSGDPVHSPEAQAELHSYGIGGAVYSEQLVSGARALVGTEASLLLITTAMDHAKSILDRMSCRDPLEEILVLQARPTPIVG